MKKNVSFNKYKKINLIPIYYEIDNCDDLWWKKTDYKLIASMAIKELIRLLTIHPCMNIAQARKLLYQPNNISYDYRNFI